MTVHRFASAVLAATVLLCPWAAPARAQTEGATEVLTQIWVALWRNSKLLTHAYDAAGNQVETVNQTWSVGSGVWVNQSRSTRDFDNQHNLQQVVTDLWTGAWNPYVRYDYVYFGTSLTSYTQQSWGGGVWQNDARISYTYGPPFNGVNEELHEDWSGGQWVNQARYVQEYDLEGHVSARRRELWVANQWLNSSLSSYSYAPYLLSEEIYQTWNGTGWQNVSRFDYDYGSGQLAQTTFQSWESGAWANESRYTYAYDGALLQTTLVEAWGGSGWNNDLHTAHTYDATGRLVESLTTKWNGSVWNNQVRVLYTYPATTSVDGAGGPRSFRLLGAYPNPARGAARLAIELDRAATLRIEVFDVAGRLVRDARAWSSTGRQTVDLDVRGLDPGVYLYRVQAGSESRAGRLTVAR